MYVDSSSTTVHGKTYTRHLLRESFREDGKVKHRSIANLSKCSEEEIEAIRLALRHKANLAEMIEASQSLRSRQGLSAGAVWLLYAVARQLGIDQALGPSRQGRLALWQVIARLIDQGSRLSAVRLAGSHAACDILGLEAFDEEDLYGNLDWLAERQEVIEQRLFQDLCAGGETGFFLYDVTSSYLEGTQNELAEFGYNRDGKKGKKQIVIGLLCEESGEAVSCEVFQGNTQDPQTFGPQIRKVAQRFGVQAVTFVGDRGMIKSHQVKALGEFEDTHFHYITAITKPQIRSLMKHGAIQLDLFDNELAEITTAGGLRYVLRRNPARVLEIEASRQDKRAALEKQIRKRNAYLADHPRASLAVAQRDMARYAAKLCISPWTELTIDAAKRQIALAVNEEALAQTSQLDGCYVLKTDLAPEAASKQTVHARYKDLAMVESAFRTSKTVELELRPIHVRLATRTRGHVFVVMLAYRIARHLAQVWDHIDLTVQEAIDQLATLCTNEILREGRPICAQIPEPRQEIKNLIEAADVQMPEAIPCKGVIVTTKRKLPSRRTNH
jgi:hypothetical protein